jgi:hypothetical protein
MLNSHAGEFFQANKSLLKCEISQREIATGEIKIDYNEIYFAKITSK